MSTSRAKIKQFLINLDTSNDITIDNAYGSSNREFSNVIIRAIEHASGGSKGSDEFNDWLNDAAQGNSVALKPVLDTLRKALERLA
jgi:hypothetical protein